MTGLPRRTIIGAVAAIVSCTHAAAANALAREEQILTWMQGEWAFALGERIGARMVRMAYPNHLVACDESVFESDIRGEGYTGGAPLQDLFYRAAAHSAPGVFSLMFGERDPNEDAIRFTPQAGSDAEPIDVVWRKVSENQYPSTVCAPAPGGGCAERWKADFRRITEPAEE